jgi:predicted porin
MKANFLLESDFDATKDGTANFGSKGGETYVGVSGGFGAFQVGAPNTPSLDVSGRTPFGTKIGSGFANTGGTGTGKGVTTYGVQGAGHVRENNSVVYIAPTIAGFTAKAGYQFNTDPVLAANSTAVSAAKARTDLGLTYVNGPITAVIANYQQKDAYKQTHGYVAYQAGPLKVTYGFNRDNRIAAAGGANNVATGATLAAGKLAGNNIAADYQVASNINLLANYGKLNDKTTDNFDRKITAVGAKYTLSARTSLYARAVSEKLENTTAAYNRTSIKTTLVGLQHNF